MKKKIEILIILAILLASITATIVYASVSSTELETVKIVSTASISKSSDIFEKLDTNSSNVNSKVVYDELNKANIYEL